MNPGFLDGLLTELSNNWASYAFPGISALLDLYGVSINDVIDQLASDFEDGSLFDRGLGAIDGYLDALNPLDSFWSIPDFGAQFGNEDEYATGHTIGAIGGAVASIAVGAFGPGMVQCGSWGQKALMAYEFADIAGGLGTAAQSISSGNFGLSDAINIAGAVLSAKGLKSTLGGCFVGDTMVVVPDHLNFQPQVAGLLPERIQADRHHAQSPLLERRPPGLRQSRQPDSRRTAAKP